jgi:hypothetical protein
MVGELLAMGGERAPAPDRLAQRSQVRVVEVDLDVAEADRGPVVGQVGDPVEQALGVRPRELDLEVAGGIVGADEPLASGDLVRVRAHNLLFSVLSVTSVSVTDSRRRPRESWACPAARTLRAQSESGSLATTYRLPLTVSGETGAERGLPVRRPGTVSTQTGPIVSPMRDMASARGWWPGASGAGA